MGVRSLVAFVRRIRRAPVFHSGGIANLPDLTDLTIWRLFSLAPDDGGDYLGTPSACLAPQSRKWRWAHAALTMAESNRSEQ